MIRVVSYRRSPSPGEASAGKQLHESLSMFIVSSDSPVPPRREARQAAVVSISKTRNAVGEPAALVRPERGNAEWGETKAPSANAGDTIG
jgi:hypothetical protein